MDDRITGNDVSRLVQVVNARGYRFGPVETLEQSYRIARDQRVIYLDGRLDAGAYFGALRSALAELGSDGLGVLHPRPVPLRSVS